MKTSTYLVHFILLTALFSCTADTNWNGPLIEEPKTKQLFNYYPLIVGSEYIYRVDSVDFGSVIYDTVIYWQREKIGSEETSLDGKKYSRIEVFVKNEWEGTWIKIRNDLARNTEDVVERYTENIMYIKHTIPYSTNRVWNVAPYNDISFLYGANVDFSECRYQEPIHSHAFIDEWGFDSTLTVIQFEAYFPINRYNFRERYANNVGMYYKHEMSANFQDPNPGEVVDTSTFIPKSGYILTKRLLEYKVPRK